MVKGINSSGKYDRLMKFGKYGFIISNWIVLGVLGRKSVKLREKYLRTP